MQHIYNGIWLGNRNDACNHELLETRNIAAVLNVAADQDTPVHKDIVTCKIGITGSPDLVGRNPVGLAVYVLDQLYGEYKHVLVYCGAGHNRSPLVTALWMNCFKGVKFEAAAKLVNLEMQPWMAEWVNLTQDTPVHNLRWEHVHRYVERPPDDGPV